LSFHAAPSTHPTRSARGLSSKTIGNLDFILSEDHFSRAEIFSTRIFPGSEFEARTHNFYILLTAVAKSIHLPRGVPRFLVEQNVDGVIIAGKVKLGGGRRLSEVFEILEQGGIASSSVELRRPTLEAVFLHLTGRRLRD